MNFKNFKFSCPHCNATLSNEDEVTLSTIRKSGEKGTIYLSVAFGNYTYRHIPETDFEKDEIVDFHCPKCNIDLKSQQHEDFALLNMNVEDNINFEVIFSRVAGKRKTYVITEDGIETYQG